MISHEYLLDSIYKEQGAGMDVEGCLFKLTGMSTPWVTASGIESCLCFLFRFLTMLLGGSRWWLKHLNSYHPPDDGVAKTLSCTCWPHIFFWELSVQCSNPGHTLAAASHKQSWSCGHQWGVPSAQLLKFFFFMFSRPRLSIRYLFIPGPL